jgi:hypothetical protein
MNDTLQLLAKALGYVGDRGYIEADAFAHQPNHRHALRLAAQEMGVEATFGLWTGPEGSLLGPDHRRFTPLVYLAQATDADHARSIHRSVWSQGLAPYLLVSAPDRIWLCQGFAFSAAEWGLHAVEVKTDDWPRADDVIGSQSVLRPVLAQSLRSALSWRDEARAADDFVDERLLRSLADLSVAFAGGMGHQHALVPEATNALVARLLYFFFLVDRRFITEERLATWGLTGVGLDDQDWTLEGANALFERLDDIFNGSIFPIPEQHRRAYAAEHINTLRKVIRHGAGADVSGTLQFSFFDYDFASIRTETLSAIYEMFLRNEVEDAGTRFGAFYTPPYLADYVLDRLEDDRPLTASARVLDPAAGSGVFLVGAYRRIVEASLEPGQTSMKLEALHALMTNSIFAVELNPTACHVAAFSLYLTMLDYVEPAEAADYTCWPVLTGRPKLFPPMLKAPAGQRPNILAADFFAPATRGMRCDVVVGNPPWVQLPKLQSPDATAYFKALKKAGRPIGDQQAAELFTWKAYEDHLEPDGILALLVPQKSLVNKFSEKFVDALRTETELVGVADLAHLRYALFRRSGARTAGSSARASAKGARQATAAILLRKRRPHPEHKFWSFRPLRPTQPSSRRNRLWILIHDWTQVTWHTQTDLSTKSWRRVFTCSPVDRRVLGQFDRLISAGRLSRLSDLGQSIGLHFKIETDQNIDRAYVLSQDPKQKTYWLMQLGLEPGLFDLPASAFPLPQAQIERSPPSSRPFLQGNVVVLPRTCERAVFVERPVATSFMIVACFTANAGKPLSSTNQRFMRALAAYMSTRTFRYLCYINSRRVFSDRANVELSAVTELPWPFGGLEQGSWDGLLEADPEQREVFVAEALGLPPAYQAVIREYDSFRERFNDGQTPDEALLPAKPEEMDDYLQALLQEVDGHRGRHVARATQLGTDLAAALIRYQPADAPLDPQADVDRILRALEAYRAQGASTVTQSRYIWHSRHEMTTVLIKPVQRLHWTLDRAFADADLVLAAILAGAASREAA